ncbi:MAG TPA: isochorismatase family protein [Pseudonocardia sp.]|nr:isochorismatase family protein [Pseudonocardia sp.]
MSRAQALVLVDVQRGFVSGERAVPAAQVLLHTLDGLVAAARAGGALVVHLRNDGTVGAPDEPHTPGVPRRGVGTGRRGRGRRDCAEVEFAAAAPPP